MKHCSASRSDRPTALLRATRVCAAAVLLSAFACDGGKTPQSDAKSSAAPAAAPAPASEPAKEVSKEVPPAETPMQEAPKPEAPRPEAPKPEVPKPEAPKPEAPKEDPAKAPAKDSVKISKEFWETTGKLKFTYEMRKSANGKWARNGIGRAYYDTGAVEREGTYKNNVRVGHWTYYDADGKVLRTEERGADGKGGTTGEPPLP